MLRKNQPKQLRTNEGFTQRCSIYYSANTKCAETRNSFVQHNYIRKIAV